MFVDKRIGEKDNDLSAEDKMIARFTMERMKNSGKKSKFHLGDEENLTHYGQSISEIEQFEDDLIDSMKLLLNKVYDPFKVRRLLK